MPHCYWQKASVELLVVFAAVSVTLFPLFLPSASAAFLRPQTGASAASASTEGKPHRMQLFRQAIHRSLPRNAFSSFADPRQHGRLYFANSNGNSNNYFLSGQYKVDTATNISGRTMAVATRKRKATRAATATAAASSTRSGTKIKAEVDNEQGTERTTSTTNDQKNSNNKYKLLMILSPAKTLNLKDDVPDGIGLTKPLDGLKSRRTEVVAAMKSHASSASKLGALLKTSQKITSAAQGYWQQISGDASGGTTTKPSIFLFNGAAYSGLDIGTMATKANLEYLQGHLRIVDPLYGWLRPMDEVEAYRLEMATKGVFAKSKTKGIDPKVKLEDYWKAPIRSCIEEEERGQADANATTNPAVIIVNLASDEYSAAVDVPAGRIVKVVFKHGGRTIAVHAKRARGLMVRFMAMNAVESLDELLGFDLEGYTFRPGESTYNKGDHENFSNLAALGSRQPKQEKEESASLAKKQKTKKAREQPLTLVFDRPGTWKRS